MSETTATGLALGPTVPELPTDDAAARMLWLASLDLVVERDVGATAHRLLSLGWLEGELDEQLSVYREWLLGRVGSAVAAAVAARRWAS